MTIIIYSSKFGGCIQDTIRRRSAPKERKVCFHDTWSNVSWLQDWLEWTPPSWRQTSGRFRSPCANECSWTQKLRRPAWLLWNVFAKFVLWACTIASVAPQECKVSVGKATAIGFSKVQAVTKSSNLLVHFDSSKEIVLPCDATPYGLGAVISHVIDGVERPISCASRTLSSAEKGMFVNPWGWLKYSIETLASS